MKTEDIEDAVDGIDTLASLLDRWFADMHGLANSIREAVANKKTRAEITSLRDLLTEALNDGER